MFSDLLKYDLGTGAEAFSTRRDSELPYPVIQGHQVHNCKVAVIDRPGITREELEGFDAFVTELPGVAIGVRTADCVPVLLYDPVNRVVAAVHSGWKGTVKHISQKAIDVMVRKFRSKPEDLRAVIGPGIGPDSFQVGEEVVGQQGRRFPNRADMVFHGPRRRYAYVGRTSYRPFRSQPVAFGRNRGQLLEYTNGHDRHLHRSFLLLRPPRRSTMRQNHQFHKTSIIL